MSQVHSRRRVVLGSVGAPHGVKGWVKIQPFTESRDTLLAHSSWQVGRPGHWTIRRVLEGRGQGSQLVVHFEGLDDRDEARMLTGSEVALWRDELPPAADGEFYWSDLEGLTVVTRDGTELGQVRRLMETGANDVLVVMGDRERLIPVLWDTVILQVDLDAGRMQVDWDPDF